MDTQREELSVDEARALEALARCHATRYVYAFVNNVTAHQSMTVGQRRKLWLLVWGYRGQLNHLGMDKDGALVQRGKEELERKIERDEALKALAQEEAL